MTAVDYTEILRRRWRLIVLVAICTTLGAVALGPRLAGDPSEESSSYRATSTLLVRGNLDYTLQQLALLASDGAVPRSAAEKVGEGGTPTSVDSVSTSIDVDGDILTIQVEGTDAERAEALSAAISEELIAFVGAEQEEAARAAEEAAAARLQELAVQIEVLDERIAADPDDSLLRAQRQGLVAAYTLELRADPAVAPSAGSITVLDAPISVPLANDSFVDASGTLPRRLTLGVVLGSLLAVGVALVVDRFDTRLRDRKSVEETTGVPVLIELPLTNDGRSRRSGLVFGPHYNGPLAERFRRLRSALLLVGDRESIGPSRTDVVKDRRLAVLVCSPGASAVRSTAAANLAAAFAESGRSVILVTQRVPGSCADLLVGESHEDAEDDGLTTHIDHLHEALLSTEVAGLQLLDLRRLRFERGQFGKLLAGLDTAADVVIYDVPPLLINADAMEFLPYGSIAVLVVRAGSTRSAAVNRAAELLRLGRVPVVVSVLIGRRRHRRLGTRPVSPEPPIPPVNVVPERPSSGAPELSGRAGGVGQLIPGESDAEARSFEDDFRPSGEPDGRKSAASPSSRSIAGVEPAIVIPSSVPSEAH